MHEEFRVLSDENLHELAGASHAWGFTPDRLGGDDYWLGCAEIPPHLMSGWTAHFTPRGLWGRLSWFLLLPFHFMVFGPMARAPRQSCGASRRSDSKTRSTLRRSLAVRSLPLPGFWIASVETDGQAAMRVMFGPQAILVGVVVSGAVLLAACGSTPAAIESPVTEQEATEMAQNALQAFNDRDYSAWSRDWSETMKAAIDEDAFVSFRDQFHTQLGDWTDITSVTGGPGADEGTYRWTFDLEFEDGSSRMWFGFKEGSPLIEGVAFEEIPDS